MRIGSYARPNPFPYYDCTSFSFLIVIMHYDDDDSFYFEEVDKLFWYDLFYCIYNTLEVP
jgi:hypothetical protein